MPRKGGKQDLTPDQIRAQVDAVMAKHQSYATFGEMLDALMVANDNMSHKALAKALGFANEQIQLVRHGQSPSYAFVEVLANQNPLNLDPEGVKPEGSLRQILFAKAGLIEVTPESIQQFNAEVMAHVERRVAACREHPQAPKLHLMDILTRMTDFQAQGERHSREWVHEQAIAAYRAEHPNQAIFSRMSSLGATFSKIRHSSDAERQALYQGVRLTPEHSQRLEALLAEKMLESLISKRNPTSFSQQLTRILAELKEHDISTVMLETESLDSALGCRAPILNTTISTYKLGKNKPTLQSLRTLVTLLRHHERQGHLTQGATDALVAVSGFTQAQMDQTLRGAIADITEQTDAKTLLNALFDAVDTSVTAGSFADLRAHDPAVYLSEGIIESALSYNGKHQLSLSVDQTREILHRLSDVSRRNGSQALSEPEIEAVVGVVAWERAHWEEGKQHTVIAKKRASFRDRITAELDDSSTSAKGRT